MDPFAIILSPFGKLAPKPFALAVVLVYVAAFCSQALIAGPVLARSGPWPFAVAQAALAWIWFALHAKRLRDGERGIASAVTLVSIYGLAFLIGLVVFAMVFDPAAAATSENSTTASLGAIAILMLLIALLTGSPGYGVVGMVILSLLLLTLLPPLIGILYSIWAGTRQPLPPLPVYSPLPPRPAPLTPP